MRGKSQWCIVWLWGMWEENVINRSWLKSLNKLKVLQVEQLMGWIEIEVLYRHRETSGGGVKKEVLDFKHQQQWLQWSPQWIVLHSSVGLVYGVTCILCIPSQSRESPRIIFILDSSLFTSPATVQHPCKATFPFMWSESKAVEVWVMDLCFAQLTFMPCSERW